MNTLKTTNKTEELGKFTEKERNLINEMEEHKVIQGKLEAEELLIDDNIIEIDYFLDKI